MYFDQHGSFLEYKTETAKMTFPKQTDKADISTHTPLGVKEPLSQKDKNILITSTLDEKTGLLTIDMMSTDDAYDGKKTGKTLIEDPSLEATAEQKKVSNYLTQAETMSQIATNRIKVYEALRHLSSANITKENQKLFNFAYEADKTPNVVVGPSFEGVYAYKLVNKETTAKGINYPAQYIYCKVIDNKIALCDANGDALTQQKIIIKSTKDYYVVSVDDVVTGTKTTQQFKIDAKKDKTEERTPEIDTFEVEKDYTKYTGDLTAERYCSFRAYDSTSLTDSYKFDEKDGYTSLDIKVNAGQISGTDKVTGVQSFDIVDQDQDDFGSYKEFFTTKEQKNLGISEKAYKTAFNNILEDETKKTDDLVRVKYKGTDGKYYYALMHADIDQRK